MSSSGYVGNIVSFDGQYDNYLSRLSGHRLGAKVNTNNSVIYGSIKARVVAPKKIHDQYVWLTGVDDMYLQQFPEWHPAR